MLKILIPTLGRAHYQPAYDQLEAAGLNPLLILDEHDDADYGGRRTQHIKFDDKPNRGLPIAYKRQATLEFAKGEKFAMVNDDLLLFAVNHYEDDDYNDKCRISVPSAERLQQEFEQADRLLDTYAHGGFHDRPFVNTRPQPFQITAGFYYQIWMYNPKLMPVVPEWVDGPAEDVKYFVKLADQGLDYFVITSMCVVEQKRDNSHFKLEAKLADVKEIWENYPIVRRKDGRVAIRFAQIVKNAKIRLGKT